MLAQLEKEASLPKRKKQKKNLGRTPVEQKRIEILNREHKESFVPSLGKKAFLEFRKLSMAVFC